MRQRDLMDVIEQVLADPALTKAEAEFLESIKDRLKASRNEFEIGAAIVERWGAQAVCAELRASVSGRSLR